MDYAQAKVIQFTVWLKMKKTGGDQQRPRQRPPRSLFTWQMVGIPYALEQIEMDFYMPNHGIVQLKSE